MMRRLGKLIVVAFVLIAFTFVAIFSWPTINSELHPLEITLSRTPETSQNSRPPLAVKITGPSELVRRGEISHMAYAGCLYEVNWGDGTSDPDTSCVSHFEHGYTHSGKYHIVANIWGQGGSDTPESLWHGEAIVTVSDADTP